MGRRIESLVPELIGLCQQHITACALKDIFLLVYCTRRTEREQALEYAKGRKISELPPTVTAFLEEELRLCRASGLTEYPGVIVTYCYGSECPHVRGEAYDCVAMVDGRPAWEDDNLWAIVGQIGISLGLEWGGEWGMKDKPHFQLRK